MYVYDASVTGSFCAAFTYTMSSALLCHIEDCRSRKKIMLVAYRNFSLFTEPVGTIGERDVYKLIIQGVEFSVRARKMSPLLDECLDLCNEVSVSHGKSVEI